MSDVSPEELMEASKAYEHGYDDCCEAGFKQALKVAAELGWDPWKITGRDRSQGRTAERQMRDLNIAVRR
jgi:hypothetical protein